MHTLEQFTDQIDSSMSFSQFGRAVYKYTPCGPWLAAVLKGGEEVYYEEGDMILPQCELKGIKVGSIVEGSDAEIGPYMVTDPAEFWDTVDRVNRDAEEEWNEANMQEAD